MNILVVEDEPVSRNMLTMILKKNGHEVEAAASVKEAMAALQKRQDIELIISDIMMPKVDGFGLLRYLKSDRRLRRLPVILCTGVDSKDSVVKALELKVVGYIVKPVNAAVLLEKIKLAQAQSKRTVLIVDDEEIMRNLLSTCLERDGWSVLTASSGFEAIDILKSNEPQLVLSDLKMPEMDGFQLLLQIKDLNPKLPVIIVSGRSEYSRDHILAAGADDFIAKPFRNTEILQCIDSVLERKTHVGTVRAR